MTCNLSLRPNLSPCAVWLIAFQKPAPLAWNGNVLHDQLWRTNYDILEKWKITAQKKNANGIFDN